ncbi:hypothetical protein NE857_31390 [Nocardiopsis exhalans]|uniref:Uncharacterized protein n=1 Tax=Nocardiopsis exhalans TaxID=163604 RepID=A0ABY5D857_9ACTN|nr:hypothetical protein [Nocardiopsis exhalans]USY19683.1 hypothetical protein NE857_31390 [Nocardiopsis exhalans]
MKLRPPDPAHRRAATPTHPGHCPRCARLSVTLDTLPPHVAYIPYESNPGHWVIIARDGITYEELALAYARWLPAWARARIWTPLGVTDPAVDLAAHHQERWWDPEWPVHSHGLAAMEAAAAAGGYVIPWPHAWLLDTPA